MSNLNLTVYHETGIKVYIHFNINIPFIFGHVSYNLGCFGHGEGYKQLWQVISYFLHTCNFTA